MLFGGGGELRSLQHGNSCGDSLVAVVAARWVSGVVATVEFSGGDGGGGGNFIG